MPKTPLKRNEAFAYGDDQKSGDDQESISRILPKDANGVPIGGNVSKDGNKIVLEEIEGGRRRRKTRKDRRRKSRKTRANRKNRKTRNNY